MVDKDLRKLGRNDLLDMLLAQCRENDKLQAEVKLLRSDIVDLKSQVEESDQQFCRLRMKLDQKDLQIDKLITRLDQKDEEIARLHTIGDVDVKSLASAAVRVSDLFQAAQNTASQYIEGAKAIEQKRRKLYEATVNKCRKMEAVVMASHDVQV